MRDDRERLLDIQEAITRIEKYAAKGRLEFENNELIQTWVLHHFQIIGEAARSLSAVLRDQHQEIPWPKIIGMRNILVHHYFGIDIPLVWSVVDKELPELKANVEAILQRLPNQP
jgi:uncharacterized protein with HEPN domain